MPKMAEYVDWVNVMSYDYHGFVWYLPFTGHNAPLLPKANDRGVFEKLNVRWSVERWLGLGMPPEKIMLGIPVYGRNYK
jgi:chitinase